MLPVNSQLTMSTREIAKLLGKNHSDIKRSAERLFVKGVLTQPLAGSDFEHNGNRYQEYLLEKRDSLVLVAQNCPEFTARVIDRWQELENQNNPMVIASTMNSQQLALLMQETKAKEEAQEQLQIAAPKVAFVDNLVDRTGLMNATQVGQPHGLSAVKLNKTLDEFNVYNKAVKRGRAFQQWFVDKGYGEMKQTDAGFPQALFTNSGAVWIHEKLTVEGVI